MQQSRLRVAITWVDYQLTCKSTTFSHLFWTTRAAIDFQMTEGSYFAYVNNFRLNFGKKNTLWRGQNNQ